MSPSEKTPIGDRTQMVGDKDSTTFRVMTEIYRHKVPHAPQLFAASLAFTLFGILVSFKFFAAHAGMVSVFFAVMGMSPTFHILVDVNKKKVENLKVIGKPRWRADLRLAGNLLAIFVGMLLAYGLCGMWLELGPLEEAFDAQVGPWLGLSEASYEARDLPVILLNNLGVAFGTFVLALLYRIGGALIVLTWNASVWGILFAYFAKLQSSDGLDAALSYVKTLSCVMPHTALEALGYICAALAGILVLRLIARGGDEDIPFKQTLGVVGILGLGSAIVTLVAALVESWLTPTLIGLIG
ncbi:MAG: stage II sporulation protein M [Myxococcota bacterium]|nr:stage II sporulation protein M [Myxococcota bacterium]